MSIRIPVYCNAPVNGPLPPGTPLLAKVINARDLSAQLTLQPPAGLASFTRAPDAITRRAAAAAAVAANARLETTGVGSRAWELTDRGTGTRYNGMLEKPDFGHYWLFSYDARTNSYYATPPQFLSLTRVAAQDRFATVAEAERFRETEAARQNDKRLEQVRLKAEEEAANTERVSLLDMSFTRRRNAAADGTDGGAPAGDSKKAGAKKGFGARKPRQLAEELEYAREADDDEAADEENADDFETFDDQVRREMRNARTCNP